MARASSLLRAFAWSTLTVSAAWAQYTLDGLSFGHREGAYISPNLRAIPHFVVRGSDEFQPQILSDRIILTPPYPGSRRSAVWAEERLNHQGDWVAKLDFRATGMERGAGNLQLWYTKDSQAHEPPANLYTAGKFDGLVLVIDQYEGKGGSLRGFLNDGSIDYKMHDNVDTLAFAKCDHAYRNRGVPSKIELHRSEGLLEVMIDGESCFRTDKVQLPPGYYFGISATSTENPDSFEIFKFAVATAHSYGRDEPNQQRYQPQDHQQQQNVASQQGHEQQTHKQNQKQASSIQRDIPKMLEDVLAGSIKNQQDQFADLHNRIQNLNHQVAAMYEFIEKIHQDHENRFVSIMNRIVPMDDRTAATMRNVEKVERTTMEILRDVESKDFKDLLNQVHMAIENGQEGLAVSLPHAVNTIVSSHKPSIISFLFIAVAIQIMVTGAYLVYKKRRNGAPKKYL